MKYTSFYFKWVWSVCEVEIREQSKGVLKLKCFLFGCTTFGFYECQLSIVCLSLTLCLNILFGVLLFDEVYVMFALIKSAIKHSRIYFSAIKHWVIFTKVSNLPFVLVCSNIYYYKGFSSYNVLFSETLRGVYEII